MVMRLGSAARKDSCNVARENAAMRVAAFFFSSATVFASHTPSRKSLPVTANTRNTRNKLIPTMCTLLYSN